MSVRPPPPPPPPPSPPPPPPPPPADSVLEEINKNNIIPDSISRDGAKAIAREGWQKPNTFGNILGAVVVICILILIGYMFNIMAKSPNLSGWQLWFLAGVQISGLLAVVYLTCCLIVGKVVNLNVGWGDKTASISDK